MRLTGEMFGHGGPEYDEVVADAASSLGRTHEERAEMFCGIQELIGAIWENFTEEEMRERLRIGEALEPTPNPWWSRMRPEARQ